MEKEELSEDRAELLEQIADLDGVYGVRPIEEVKGISISDDDMKGYKGLKLDVYLED